MPNPSPRIPSGSSRWFQLFLGLIVMMSISSPQYVWTLFVKSFQGATGASLPSVQLTFSVLIVLQTWLSPLQGWFVERFGPRLLVGLGAALSGVGWLLAAHASNLIELLLSYGALCGIGTGIVYVGIVGLMARWFPDHRGLAIGTVAAGYGMGALVTTFPIDSMIKSSGHAATLSLFGIVLGLIGVLAALGLRPPRRDDLLPRSREALPSGRDLSPAEMIRQPIFWLMFMMMTMMSTGGLMVTSNFANFAKDFGVANQMLFGVAVLPLALSVDRTLNGFTRPFFGWVSDRIGRERTMALAFTLEAIAIFLMLMLREDPMAFVLLSGLVFFGWGEIFSLFPSTLTDTFGTRHATTNYGLLYMAQGIGSILGGPAAAALREVTGSWIPVFCLVIAMDVLTAVLALGVLRSMRVTYLRFTGSAQGGQKYGHD